MSDTRNHYQKLTMKLLTVFLLLFGYFAPASAQKQPKLDAISNYFSEYVDDTTFTAVYVSGKLFELFGDADIDLDELEDEEVRAILDVVKDVQGIRILHTDRNARMYYEKAKRRIPTSHYELLFKVRTQDGENVEAFVQDDNAAISELFLLVGGEDTFAMLSFVGRIDLKKIGALQRALD